MLKGQAEEHITRSNIQLRRQLARERRRIDTAGGRAAAPCVPQANIVLRARAPRPVSIRRSSRETKCADSLDALAGTSSTYASWSMVLPSRVGQLRHWAPYTEAQGRLPLSPTRPKWTPRYLLASGVLVSPLKNQISSLATLLKCTFFVVSRWESLAQIEAQLASK